MEKPFGNAEVVIMPWSSAAENKPEAGESPFEESSSKSDEKPDEVGLPDAEGFYGVPNGVIDDPDGYVNLRKDKSTDSRIVAKVVKDERSSLNADKMKRGAK